MVIGLASVILGVFECNLDALKCRAATDALSRDENACDVEMQFDIATSATSTKESNSGGLPGIISKFAAL